MHFPFLELVYTALLACLVSECRLPSTSHKRGTVEYPPATSCSICPSLCPAPALVTNCLVRGLFHPVMCIPLQSAKRDIRQFPRVSLNLSRMYPKLNFYNSSNTLIRFYFRFHGNPRLAGRDLVFSTALSDYKVATRINWRLFNMHLHFSLIIFYCNFIKIILLQILILCHSIFILISTC